MHRRSGTILSMVLVLGLAGTLAAQSLDTSVWPVAGQGPDTREAVIGITPAGDGLRQAWRITGLGTEPTGAGGGVLSSDGYFWFRSNGPNGPGGVGYLFKINTATGAIEKQIQMGIAYRSAPLVTTDKVYVSYGDGADTGIKVFNRLDPNLPEVMFMQNTAVVNSQLRSLQLGTVSYGGNKRIYAVRRATNTYISAWDAVTGDFKWEATIVRPGGGVSGLCQLGPLWVDGAGKQRMAICTGNGAQGFVVQVRDDDTFATVLSTTALDNSAYVNGQGALSADGSKIYYNAANDGGKPALHAVSTGDAGGVVWAVPQSALPVNCFVANPAVIGNRVYLACAGGNVAAVDDLGNGPTDYSVAWVYNVGETGEFTNISAAQTTGGRKFLYCSNQTSSKLYHIEDLGTSATTLNVMNFVDSASYACISTTVDANGAVYQFGGVNGGLFKYITGTPPVANAGADITNAPCYGSFNVDGSGSYAIAPATIVNYKWTYGTTVLYDGPNAIAPVTLPVCNGTYVVELRVTDSNGFEATDTVNVTVGFYPTSQLEFTVATGPAVGHWFKNSLASGGGYLYYYNNQTGELYRTNSPGCNAVWEQLASAPGGALSDYSGALVYTSAIGAQGSLIAKRRDGAEDCGYGDKLAVYDIASNTWTFHQARQFGSQGFVAVGDHVFGSAHAVDTNQGGPLTRINVVTGLDDFTAQRTGIWQSLPGRDRSWFSRVVQLAVLDGWIYGFKNDWSNGGQPADGDRIFKFNPAAYSPNTWGGDPNQDHCTYPGPGHLVSNWTNNPQTPATDLGNLPIEPGYGAALVALPANWKGLVGAQGGLFVIWGRRNANHEGWGSPNREYGYLDLATNQWRMGFLPDWSSSGTAAVMYDGEIVIKQGCSDPGNPDGNPTDVFWITGTPPPPVPVDAGNDQSLVGTCGLNAVTLQGTVPPGYTITSWTWQEGNTVLGTGPVLNYDFLPGVHVITLTVVSDQCATGVDSVTVTIYPPEEGNEMPAYFSMTENINFGAGDAITAETYTNGTIEWWSLDAPNGFHAQFLGYANEFLGGQGWYYGPNIELDKACYFTPIDVSHEAMVLAFTARYFQDANNWGGTWGLEPYQDAPIFVTMIDSNGYRGCLGIVYGPDMRNDPDQYPNWKTVRLTGLTVLDPNPDFTDAGFDPTRVRALRMFGTDWGGKGSDFVEIKDVYLGLLGDMNCDGKLDGLDINAFVLAILDPTGYATQYPDCKRFFADCNLDGNFDHADVAPFVDFLLP